MSDEIQPDPTCAVCGRRLLPGERPSAFITRDGAEVVVCELCKPRAEASGWLRPDEADALRAAGGVRERRRPRSQMLTGLLSRFPAPADGADEEEAPARARRRPPREDVLAPEAEGPVRGSADPVPVGNSPGTTMPQAITAFNVSDHRRTVAGLTRTLGPPRATAIAVRAKSGYPGVRLTVAWELTWYQWEVGPGPAGPEVRESGKGETIDQLRAADRRWNLMVDSDGTLQQRAAQEPSPEPAEEA
jgi:hypothetical protein